MNPQHPLRALLLLAALTVALGMGARSVKTPKMYVFGFAASFNTGDSIVHFTDVQEMDSVWTESSNGFVLARSVYAEQFRQYLSGKLDMPFRTVVVVCYANRKKLEKTYLRMKHLYTAPDKNGQVHYDVRYVGSSDFHFVPAALSEDELDLPNNQTKAQKKAARRAAKQARREQRGQGGRGPGGPR